MRNIQAIFIKIYRSIWQQRGHWLRGVLCWAIGMVMVLVDVDPKYDTRFQIRPPRTTMDDIVILHISQNEWISWQGQRRNWVRPLREIDQLSDSFYWNATLWQQLLKAVLSRNPQAVGISFYFGENIRRPRQRLLNSPEFNDPRVIWSAHLDTEGRVAASRFASSKSNNSGLNEFALDRDGVLRRIHVPISEVPQMSQRLAQFHPEHSEDTNPFRVGENKLINFRGNAGSYKHLSLTDLLSGNFPQGYLENKTVIIGSLDSDGHVYQTPLGPMSRAEVIATTVENTLQNQWIHRLSYFFCALYLLALLIFAIWVMSSYPHTVALLFLFCVGAATSTFSLWVFDAFNFWLPILAPVVLFSSTFIIFLSLQMALKDYLNSQLEQERKFLVEVEELKNNFVSLISHDLKTPIAKIHAICDRLIAENPKGAFIKDIQSLRDEGSELNRYIRTILHISRVEARDFKINIDASDLNETVENVIHQVAPLAQAKGILLEQDLEPMFLVDMDAILIHEVVHNLLTNAIKYTPEGGSIRVTTKDVNHRVIFSVEDNGPGISQEDQNRIFEKFFRGAQDNAQAKGSGLGLYLVKYFVELHQGQVFVDSALTKGTKVGFSLPVGAESSMDDSIGGVEL